MIVIGTCVLAAVGAAGWAATVLLAEAELDILESAGDTDGR